MSKVKKARVLVITITAVFLILAGYICYSKLGSYLSSEKIAAVTDTENEFTNQPAKVNSQLKDETGIEISQDILDLIKASDPDDYTKNVDNYKSLLKTLNVHIVFKNEIERLIREGHKLPDILIAYTYLNVCYGSVNNLEKMIKVKETGKSWPDIFKAYKKGNPEFAPRSFDSQYLQKLLNTADIGEDDVMIADRVSQNAKAEFENIINKKIEGLSWRLINAQYGIVNGLEKSPHLSLTREKLTKYTKQSGLSEKEVVGALTISQKLGKTENSVLKSIKQGLSIEDIFALAYEEKYY